MSRERSASPSPVTSDRASGLAVPPSQLIIERSHQRSLSLGISPSLTRAPADLDMENIADARDQSPLFRFRDNIEHFVSPDARAIGAAVGLLDAKGRILWVDGEASVLRRLRRIGFAVGANWSEDRVGTNAMGIALADRAPIAVSSEQHFVAVAHPYSCTSVPIISRKTSKVMGAIDITGGPAAAQPKVLRLLQIARAAMEAELHILELEAPDKQADCPRLEVLGPGHPTLTSVEGAQRLSLRHAEILTLLHQHPDGVDSATLTTYLTDRDAPPTTVRTEIHRLRHLLPEKLSLGPSTSPYRLKAPLCTDLDEVRDALERGALHEALDQYTGELLPQSHAPEIQHLRDDLSFALRASALASTDPEVVLKWGNTAQGRSDWQAWERLHELAKRGSTTATFAESKLTLLDEKLN